MNDIALFGHLIWIKSNGISKTCGFSFNLQRVYVATSRQLKRIESVSRSPIFNNFFETINGASTIRAFGQQQRLIRDNYYRVDENHVAFYPGTSANRCVNTIRLFILIETFVKCDVIMVCFLNTLISVVAVEFSTWSLIVLVKGENAFETKNQELK